MPAKYTDEPHLMCVTVHQPGCPDIENCFQFDGFAALDSRSASQHKTPKTLKISNPSSGSIWLSIAYESGEARLYSAQGTLVKTFELHSSNYLDVTGVSSGQYFLKIKTGEESISKLVLIHN